MAKVLIVDDSETVRNEVSNFLQSNGISVSTAMDGIDGLSKLSTDGEIKLVICDINMPNMDGLTMVQKFKSNQSDSNVNIIMLTTDNDPIVKQRAKAAGVNGWIVKPFNGNAVLGAIQKLIA